jgi:PKD repeat protein
MKKLLLPGAILLIMACLLVNAGCQSSKSITGSGGNSGIIGKTAIPTINTRSGITFAVTTTMAQPGFNGAPASGPGANTAESYAPDIQRMIVRTSNMTIVVSDIPTAFDKITKLATVTNGWVVESNQWKENGSLLGTISIRVPADKFDSVMSSLRGMADEVTAENTSAQDVTQEYTDLNSTLTNLQATEAQLLEIMKKAVTVDEILAVQTQLTNTRGQIETTKGRMQYLEQTSATSLITISLTQSKMTVNLTAVNGRIVAGGDNVTFNAVVSGGFVPYNYKWDFGDKTTSTDESPVHAYGATGKFTVSLTVTDDKGNTSNDTRTDYITVQSGWNIGHVAKSAWSGLGALGRVIVNILIWVGIFSPVWIIIGGFSWWFWRKSKAKKT